MNEGNFLSLRAEEHPKFFSTLIQLRFKKFDFIYIYGRSYDRIARGLETCSNSSEIGGFGVTICTVSSVLKKICISAYNVIFKVIKLTVIKPSMIAKLNSTYRSGNCTRINCIILL